MVPFLRDVTDRTAFEVVEMNGGIENFAKILESPEENCKQSKYYEFYEIESTLNFMKHNNQPGISRTGITVEIVYRRLQQ